MKIAILCGSLEPGKDGVGDYTRQLAQFCREKTHAVLQISLNDVWVDKNVHHPEKSEIRLSRNQTWPERMQVLQTALAQFQPDIVSLQFVPYAYHPRGFCSALAEALGSIGKEFRWHIMFHELWLGLNPTDSWKYKITGWWQRRCALNIVKNLAPVLTHTHTAAYAGFLKMENIATTRLPLFSNIVIQPNPDFAFLDTRFAAANITISVREETLVAVFFGSLHPEWSPDLLMQKMTGKMPVFLSIGRQGDVGGEIWRQFSQKYEQQARFLDLGELAAGEISAVLQFADVGIAASPWNLIGKSGSVAAMVEHGLPVIVTRNDFLPDQELETGWDSELHPIWRADFSLDRLKKRPPAPRLPEIGFQFLDNLQQSGLRA